MIVSILLDSFDTPFFGCTTHLAALILHRISAEGLQLADYPWLIRLNPVIPWKTRGNGAVAIHVHVDGPSEAKRLASIVLELARKYDVEGGKATLLALVFEDIYEVMEQECTRKLYVNALTKPLPLDTINSCLKILSQRVVASYGLDRRGVIGALAAAGGLRPGDDNTFELLAYRCPENWLKPRSIEPESVIEYDYLTGPYTFANYDYETARVLVTPHGTDPVLYGVRGENPHYLLKALDTLRGEEPAFATIFRTNQATNAHLKHGSRRALYPYEVVIVEGRVEEKKVLTKGHVLIMLRTRCCGLVPVMVYRETGRLNQYVQKVLDKGFYVKVYGAVKPRRGEPTLNAEAIEQLDPTPFDISDYAVPGTRFIVASTSSLHHLAKPFERYLNLRALGLEANMFTSPSRVEASRAIHAIKQCSPKQFTDL